MHNSPVYTRIINLQNTARSLMLCGRKSVWLPALAEVEVPYEVWSLADKGQKDALANRLKSGKDIRLIVGVRGTNGVYVETELGLTDNRRQTTDQEKSVAPLATSKSLRDKIVKDYGIERSSVKDEHEQKPTSTTTVSGEAAKVAERVGMRVEKVEAPMSAADEAAMSNKEKFEDACKWKRWSEALGCLKAEFGQDIKVNIRTLMSVKDWDAIVEKYELSK